MNRTFIENLTKAQIVKVSDVTLQRVANAADAFDNERTSAKVRKVLNIANDELVARGLLN